MLNVAREAVNVAADLLEATNEAVKIIAEALKADNGRSASRFEGFVIRIYAFGKSFENSGNGFERAGNYFEELGNGV